MMVTFYRAAVILFAGGWTLAIFS